MDFGSLPPEVNSARMYAGPGSGSMLAAAAAWTGLAADLHATAAAYGTVVARLTSGSWLGPSSESMAAIAAAFVQWLTVTAANAEHTGVQAKTAAAAHAAAFGMTVPPVVVAANRAQLAGLIATNIFGQNTPAIAATEAHYAEMWAQDATAMYAYAAASQSASQMTPFMPPLRSSNAVAEQGAASAQAAGTQAAHAETIVSATQLISAVPQALQELCSPSAGAALSPGLLGAFSGMLNGPLPQLVANVATLQQFGVLPGITANMWATSATSWGISPAVAGPAAVAETPAEIGFVSASGQVGGQATAGLGEAASVGGLSVPPSWATTAPAMRLTAVEVPNTSFLSAGDVGGLFAGMPVFGGMPLMTLSGRGIADSRDRQRPDKGRGASSTDKKIAELLARQQAERIALAAEIESQERRRSES